MRPVPHASVSIPYKGRNLDISYFRRDGIGEVILFLHGLGSTKEDFLAATKMTDFEDFTICAFDFPGCGQSGHSARALKMEDLVDIALQLCLRLELDAVNLIGHSMGGLVALLLAAKYPERVKSLVSMEGNLAPEDCGVFSRRAVQADQAGASREEILVELQKQLAESAFPGNRRFAERFLKSVHTQAFFDYCHSIVGCSDDNDLLPTFVNLQQRRLFVYGSANSQLSYIPTLKADQIELLEVPHGGHWMFRDNPTWFYDGIHRFLMLR